MNSKLYGRTALESLYLDWVNNFVSMERFAEWHGLTLEQAREVIDIASKIFNSPHPEA
jgi:hypothetical protein